MQTAKIGLAEVLGRGNSVANPRHVSVSEEALDSVGYGVAFAQQGDIYIRKVDAKALCKPKNGIANHSGQLAPGNSRGSRHCVDTRKVRVFEHPGAKENPLQGPVLLSGERFTITHPEHGHITLPPGAYSITYQRLFADEIRRVMD